MKEWFNLLLKTSRSFNSLDKQLKNINLKNNVNFEDNVLKGILKMRKRSWISAKNQKKNFFYVINSLTDIGPLLFCQMKAIFFTFLTFWYISDTNKQKTATDKTNIIRQ